MPCLGDVNINCIFCVELHVTKVLVSSNVYYFNWTLKILLNAQEVELPVSLYASRQMARDPEIQQLETARSRVIVTQWHSNLLEP